MIGSQLSSLQATEGVLFQSLLSDIFAGVLSLVIIVQLVIPAVAYQIKIRKTAKELGGGPEGHWLYGNIHKYGYDKDGYNNLLALHEQYPKMACRWHSNFFMNLAAYHPDIVRPVLSQNHPKGQIMNRLMKPIVQNGLVLLRGETWKFHRRLLTSFFHFDVIKSHVEIFNDACEEFLLWAGELAKSGEAGNIVPMIQQLTFEASMRAVFSVGSKDDVRNREFPAMIDTMNCLAFQRLKNPLHMSEFIWSNLTELGRTQKAITDKLNIRAQNFLDQRRKMIQSADDAPTAILKGKGTDGLNQSIKITGDRHYIDFMDILLQAKDHDGNQIPDDDLKSEIRTFFVAGQETIGTGLNWALHCLACNKDYQDKCRDELFEKVGDKDYISSEEESKLSYMTLCIKEAQRLFPIFHVISRQLHSDIKLNDGTVLPKGLSVNVAVFMLHRSPHLWPDPLVYNPERFTPENSEGRSSFAFIPFGAGPRNCIGQVFAMHHTRVVLYQILRNFEVYYDEIPSVDSVDLTFGVTLQPTNGLHMKFRPIDKKYH